MVGHSSNGHSRVVRDFNYQPSFEMSVQSIGLDMWAIDDLLEDLKNSIARIPEFFPTVGKDPARGEMCTARYLGEPPLIVWFSYDAEHIYMWLVTKPDSDE